MRSERRLALRREHLAELSPGTLSRAAAGTLTPAIAHIRSVDYCFSDDLTCTYCTIVSLPKDQCDGSLATIIPGVD